MDDEHLLLIGHSLAGNRRLHNIQEVAEFILKHGQYGNLNITYEDNSFFLETQGTCITKIVDTDYEKELVVIIKSLQSREESIGAIEQNMNM